MYMLAFFVLAVLLSKAAGVTIGFGENDYSRREGVGPITVSLSKEGENTGNITVRVTPMTLSQYESMFGETPSDLNADDDPAEAADFDNTPQEIVLPPNNRGYDVDVSIHITNDNIQEPDEIFLVVFEVAIINDQDRGDLTLSRNISIGRIRVDSNDDVSIGFNEIGLSFLEGEGDANDTLYIVREGDAEQVMQVMLQVSDNGAKEGIDYEILQKTYIFQPSVDRLAVPIRILNDTIAEMSESFTLDILSADVDHEKSRANCEIIDDDVVTVGFNQTEFEVEEGKTIEICMVIFEPQEIDVAVDLFISTVASERVQPLDNEYVYLDGVQFKETCVPIVTLENDRAEFPYVFTVNAELAFSNSLQVVNPSSATITITDNDGSPNAPVIVGVDLVNDRKDLFIEWEAEDNELQPIDSFFGMVRIDNAETTDVKRQVAGTDVLQFTTEETYHTLESVDLDKIYLITICANNSFGFNCSDPVSYSTAEIAKPIPTATVEPPIPTVKLETLPTVTVIETPLLVLKEDRPTELEPGVIAIIIILPLLFLLVCCLILLLLLCCLCCGRDRGKNYYPEKIEKKDAEAFERYRKTRSPSTDSEDFEESI